MYWVLFMFEIGSSSYVHNATVAGEPVERHVSVYTESLELISISETVGAEHNFKQRLSQLNYTIDLPSTPLR